jgi:hypothetical protein
MTEKFSCVINKLKTKFPVLPLTVDLSGFFRRPYFLAQFSIGILLIRCASFDSSAPLRAYPSYNK